MCSDWIQHEISEAAALTTLVAQDQALSLQLRTACENMVSALQAGHAVYTFGNGGSAADANHLAEELAGRYRASRRPLPATSLTACGATVTCIANDYGFDAVFERQLRAHARAGDVAVAFSTSGKSPNILRGLEEAGRIGMVRIGMLGKGGGAAAALCEHPLIVPHGNTARIQEIHGLFLHLLCEAVERVFPPVEG